MKNIKFSWRKLIFKKKSDFFVENFSRKTFRNFEIFIFQIDFPKKIFKKKIDLEKKNRYRFFFSKIFLRKVNLKNENFKISKMFRDCFFQKKFGFFFENQFSSWKNNIFHPIFFTHKVWTVTIVSARLEGYIVKMPHNLFFRVPEPPDFGVTGIFSRAASYVFGQEPGFDFIPVICGKYHSSWHWLHSTLSLWVWIWSQCSWLVTYRNTTAVYRVPRKHSVRSA